MASLVMSRWRGNRLGVFGPLVVNHAGARRFEHAFGPGKFLAHVLESARADLVGLEVHVDAVGELERQREVVQDLAIAVRTFCPP